ncbi:hypothetical protein [Pseudoalteromonas ruthenica]|uniref:hypothetical protein n=1 Tax=Pseudoalteromonas ruthenica TaxID=151081 RepID=UPI00110BF68F|nr:hypothetical protein [Pseudoalteromonas ruthenica]TMP23803.1 hypothetical protein CWC06_09630 [Pseudoalteromonas ruthenica]
MFNIIYISIGIFLLLLAVSVFLTARRHIFDKQVRDYSEAALWYEIKAQNEEDMSKAHEYMMESERLKGVVEKMTGMQPKVSYNVTAGVREHSLSSDDFDAIQNMSLGQTMRFYGERREDNVINADFKNKS